MMSLVKRHPLSTFFVLTYALSWVAYPMWASGLYPIAPVRDHEECRELITKSAEPGGRDWA